VGQRSANHQETLKGVKGVSTTWQWWLYAIVLPGLMLLGQSICVWPAPRFLGIVAHLLL
jgi:hypothetical protein